MQKDKARKETDELLKQTEKRLAKIYAEAQNDIAKKWDAYMEDAAKKIAPFEKAYQEAKEAGDQEAIRNLGITLSREKNKITTQSDYYKDMLDYTTEQLAHTNEKALDYVNNQMPRVYGINYNGTIDQIKTDAGRIGMGVSFNLLDERTIRNLVQTDKLDLPRKQLEKYKDKAWNAKAINSQMIQGILQGETIPEMAARLQNVTDMNEAAANRNARTMTTSAENSGRMDGMKAAEEKGLVYEKQWMATNDDRTRESHAEIDGESVPLDETFSNKLQYPGDPEGDPGEVYNCRCTMVRKLIGVRRRDGSIATIDEEEPELIFDLPETRQEREERLAREAEEKAHQEAEAAKATEPEKPAEERPAVQGKDISQTWQRRPEQFDFAIEDAINAQGFDGLPKVVAPEEFDKYVQESKIISQRGYTAPDKETLDEYRDQLYNGKWYVDCSTGGAAYGKGMYAAYNNGTTLDERTEDFAKRYAVRYNQEGYIETMTLDPTAKTISYNDAKKLADEISDKYSPFSEERKTFEKDFITKKINEIEDIDPTTKQYVYDRYFTGYGIKEYDADTVKWYTGLTSEEKEKVDNFVKEKIAPISEEAEEIIESYRRMDAGTAAVLHGYDAIIAGNEIGGEIVYLNRTKCIIRRSGND